MQTLDQSSLLALMDHLKTERGPTHRAMPAKLEQPPMRGSSVDAVHAEEVAQRVMIP